ncbi:MAG TPA: hypothetical protein VE224_13470 [Pseudolabrys sp.]|nr:hypothetical protein [Pseudolabrys sp.]
MRATRYLRLRGIALLAAMAMSGCCATTAHAMLTRQDALTCSDQSRDHVEERIAACTAMIKSGRVKGQPLGVAYALRDLAYLDRGRHR